MVERKQWFTVTKYGISVAILHLEREYVQVLGLVCGGRSSLFSTEMPASPPTNVIHVVMHDVRADIDTPALSALRSDGATYTFSLAFTQAAAGRPHEELGTEL